ncbi:type II secretion system protein [Geitlerinema sp. P-1104]|uniref:pilus assembly FimT family protein n=1 Tax=Geitlerinema sp. P-1104 TaxID=2546230 RepID=UPI001476C06F|nr:type II secretion system protein [Geitlerinema sp. P-1104]
MTRSLFQYLNNLRERRRQSPMFLMADEGFTTIEVLIVIVMLGVLTAIAAPSWLNFVNNQRVKNTSDAALQLMRRAQSRASTENRTWEASFRIQDEVIQGSTHAVSGGTPLWQTLAPEAGTLVTLDLDSSNLSQTCEYGEHCVRFEDRGVISLDSVEDPDDESGTLARLAFTSRDGGDDGPKRCIVVATILGSIRTDRCED